MTPRTIAAGLHRSSFSLLRARREHAAVWLEGDYVPLRGASESDRRHLIAFARRLGRETMITVAPRLVDSRRLVSLANSGAEMARRIKLTSAARLHDFVARHCVRRACLESRAMQPRTVRPERATPPIHSIADPLPCQATIIFGFTR